MSKIWFITGVSSGFGEALAHEVIEAGGKVAATFRKQEQATAFTEKYPEKGLGLLMDVTNPVQVQAATQQAIQHFGNIDVLVNNAGYGTIGAAEEVSMEEIRQQMETNFFGAVSVTKEVLPYMRKNGSGHILQISSIAGFRSSAGFGVYNASKFALEGYSEALALEVAPFNIKVVIVEPGPFRTKFAGSSIKMPQNRMPEYEATPVGKMYQYIQRTDGHQDGDPVKGAKAIIDYVNSNAKPLRLPLGKVAVEGIKAKLNNVKGDLEANEAIALSTHFDL